ncbi:MAG TPA: excinuclease ABC subunit UvrC, partial [Chitinophagaceae bacterium]|nr:excinuclease ABC subunit UvrC [Chitinophagaceae bacterium]
MTREEFSKLSQGLPGKPGIYKYFNREGIIIYVGKAKNLRKRVSSYFIKKHNYYKTERLVQEIHQLECVLVESEQDALLLENALIKEFQPKYNLMLKDDKSYPYIVIRNEEFPRVFLTRRLIRDGSEYLGPFTSVEQVRSLLDLIRQTLPLRSCKLPLTRKRIQEGRFRDCLEYHIGNCKAPCTGKQSFEEYRWYVEQVKEILKGKLGTIIKTYKDEMRQLAEQLEYEKAEIVKKRIEFLRNYQSRSVIVNPRLGDLDVCCIVSDEHSAWVHYIILTQGSIRQSHSVEVIKKLDERDQDILPQILFQLREKFQSQHVQIISNIEFSFGSNSLVSVPRGGDKKKLLELAEQNLIYFMREQKRQASLHLQEKTDQEHIELLHEVMHDLRLPQLPLHIECFDNSNFQGGAPVSAMVCFKNGIPDKKNYRHFHIKTVEGIDDFASMAETVYRRYKRVLEEKLP